MASSQLTATVDFLADAAHLLHSAAPETSAHLMRHRADLLSHANVPQHDLQRQQVCAACGHILVPGQGTTVKLETRAARRGKAARASTKPPLEAAKRTKVLTCGRCQRLTKIGLAAPERAVRRRKGAKPPAGEATRTTAKKGAPCDASKSTANASSKQRAKSRKAGLQALLSQQQQQQQSSLTLASFMGK